MSVKLQEGVKRKGGYCRNFQGFFQEANGDATADHQRAMKIRVQHRDGRMETIKLRGGFSVSEGNVQNRIKTETGMDHYFTKDGYYDGWGGAIDDSQRAKEILEEVESRREFDGADDLSTTQ